MQCMTEEWKITGAGQDKTFVHGGFKIKGKKEKGKKVELKDMAISNGEGCGLESSNGLSFLCDRLTFTECGSHGVSAYNTEGRLINCVITQCGWSGIFCNINALIEVRPKFMGMGQKGIILMDCVLMNNRPESFFLHH